MSSVSAHPFDDYERINDGFKVIVQCVCDISKQLESRESVVLYDLSQVRAGLSGVVSIHIIETDISLLELSEVFEIWIDLKEQILKLVDIRIEPQMILIGWRIRISQLRLVLHYDPLIVLDESVISGRNELQLSVSCLLAFLMALKVSVSELSRKSSHVQLDLVIDEFYDMKGIHYGDSIWKVLVHIGYIWPVHVAYKISDSVPLSCRYGCKVWSSDLLAPVYDHVYWLAGNEILDDKSVIAYLRNVDMDFIYADRFSKLTTVHIYVL